MEIKNFVKIYDEVLPWKAIASFLVYINNLEFIPAGIASKKEELYQTTDFNVRRTYSYSLNNITNSLSTTHWFNLLHYFFLNRINAYKKDNNLIDFPFGKITDIEILKYKQSGFYTWHSDHCAPFPRTISCIFLLNNDYEGGNLCFRNPDGSGEWEVEVKPNRMIIWPSNFLYPHTVKSVTKGIRYSVVAWSL